METPEFFQASYYASSAQFSADKHRHPPPPDVKSVGGGGGDQFLVEDLLDFPNDDGVLSDGGAIDAAAFAAAGGTSTDSSSATAFDASCNSSFSGAGPHDLQFAADFNCRNVSDGPFSDEFCVPYDDMAELEWLSNFVEDSFSSEEDLQKLQFISGIKARTAESSSEQTRFKPEPADPHSPAAPTFRPDMSVPAKARSKRSRAPPGNWSSRLLVVSPPALSAPADSCRKKTAKAGPKKKEGPPGAANSSEGRRCLHCATDKTPQWRTGPMGPKTLCNACGVRYKSGRLVPEYRPAASPTFTLTKHSNSHRKVLEIRRQKELVRAQHQQQQLFHHKMMFDVSNGEDYLIHHHFGSHYRQLI
ncbi:hypothetical protein DM860_000701 [Cuscuta australis]|uniref:GATA transcription factor n=1 Tax=Cuscuta australis TaxID=267555 RepID=A0A328CWZ5_9ASTE|nr:hypothetical protein DM860_000701 [Cuscuta australis]